MVDAELLKILACPACKTPVELRELDDGRDARATLSDGRDARANPPDSMRTGEKSATSAAGGREPVEGRQWLVCDACGRRYPIREGIPIMLIDEARMPAGPSGVHR